MAGDLGIDGSGGDYSESLQLATADARLPFWNALGETAQDDFLSSSRDLGDYLEREMDSYAGPAQGDAAQPIDPQQYNTKYHGLGVLFTSDMNKATADRLVTMKQDEQRRLAAQRDYPSGYLFNTANVATSLAVSAVDPVNVAAAFVPVVSEARYGLWAARAGETLARIGKGAIEGGVGTAALQPLEAAHAEQLQDQFTPYEAFVNTAFGSVLGGGLHVATGAVGDLVSGLSPDTREAALRAAVAQMAEGRTVDVTAPLASDPAFGVPDTGQRANANPDALGSHGEPTGFTTSKGSSYVTFDDGTTVRNKSYHPEHGPDDVGAQPRSEATFYVTKAQADELGLFQTQGGPGSKAIAQTGAGRWGVQYTDGPQAGMFERRTVISPQTKPAVGLIPVEIFKGGKSVHFGNEITEVRRARSTPPTTDPAYAQALADVDFANSKPETDQSLFQAITAAGGFRTRDAKGKLTPEGGDFMDAIGNDRGTTMRLVNNKSAGDISTAGQLAGKKPGLPSDQMVQELQNQGWLGPDADHSDLMDLIGREAGGSKVFHPESEATVANASRDMLGREMQDAGVQPGDSRETAAQKLADFRDSRDRYQFSIDEQRGVADHESELSPEAQKELQSDHDWIGSDEWLRAQSAPGDEAAAGGVQAADAMDQPVGEGFGGDAGAGGAATGAGQLSTVAADALGDARSRSLDFALGRERSSIEPSDDAVRALSDSVKNGDDAEAQLEDARALLDGYVKQGVVSDDELAAIRQADAADQEAIDTQTKAADAAARCLFLHP